MMWIADKVIYRNDDSTIRAYQGSELIWEKNSGKTRINYTSSDRNIVVPYDSSAFGANIISNTYGQDGGLLEFDGPVTMIGDRAFYNCTKLTGITLPDSVSVIGVSAFQMTKITSIDLPDTVSEIGEIAFANTELEVVKIPPLVTEISSLSFANCTHLTNVFLPEGLRIIRTGAFSSSGLTHIVIPPHVYRIANSAFQDNHIMREIQCFPYNPPTISQNTFTDTNECKIYVPSESWNEYISSTSNWRRYYLRRLNVMDYPYGRYYEILENGYLIILKDDSGTDLLDYTYDPDTGEFLNNGNVIDLSDYNNSFDVYLVDNGFIEP